MQNLQEAIQQERARIAVLESKLDTSRTPEAKGQLQMALRFLDDTKTAFGGDTSKAEWVALAQFNLERAREKRQAVESATHNGADKIVEVKRNQ
jgi:hypothetical protein